MLQVQSAGLGHWFDAGDWLQGTNKDAPSVSFGKAGDIQAIVDAIDEINIGVSGRAEEDLVARRAACGGVGGRIVRTQIGFDLDDSSGEYMSFLFANKELP